MVQPRSQTCLLVLLVSRISGEEVEERERGVGALETQVLDTQ